MVLVSALSSEVNRVEALVRITREVLLPLDRYYPLTRRFQRSERVARTRDELVQLERKKAASTEGLVAGAIALGKAGDEEQRPEGCAPRRFVATCLCGQLTRSFIKCAWSRAMPGRIRVRCRDSEASFRPDCEWMVPKSLVRDGVWNASID